MPPDLRRQGNLEEFEADGPTGTIAALMVRLYLPEAHQWSLNWVNSKSAQASTCRPSASSRDGRGEFYDSEMFDGRSILVRYIWSDITPKSAHFEQAFSTDGGKSWEVNWIADITRLDERADR